MNEEISKSTILNGAKKLKPEHAARVVRKEGKIKRIVKRGVLKQFVEDVNLLIQMVKDWWAGDYRRVPWWSMSSILFALLWVLNPMDLIPDAIPLIGLIDDLTVLTITLAMLEQDVINYVIWKERKEKKAEKAE